MILRLQPEIQQEGDAPTKYVKLKDVHDGYVSPVLLLLIIPK